MEVEAPGPVIDSQTGQILNRVTMEISGTRESDISGLNLKLHFKLYIHTYTFAHYKATFGFRHRHTTPVVSY